MHDDTYGDGTFSLDVPARAEHVAWVRSFASAVAQASGAPPDDVADVKLAVSELASSIVASRPGTTIAMRITRRDQRLTVSMAPWEHVEPADVDIDPWELVTMIFDGARIDGDRAVFELALSKGTT